MKTIGLIGGTGWISTMEYYRLINQSINERVGGLNAARCLLYSFNYADVAELNQKNDHVGILRLLIETAKKIEGAGADCIALCANTLHLYADDLQKEISKPIVHIGTATANEVKKKRLVKVGLLGTKTTMEEGFYKNRLNESAIETLIPDVRERAFIHRSIFNELFKNVFNDKTKEQFLQIMTSLQQQGADGIILGCTEIPLLIKQSDIDIPVFNTLEIHVQAIIDFALDQ